MGVDPDAAAFFAKVRREDVEWSRCGEYRPWIKSVKPRGETI